VRLHPDDPTLTDEQWQHIAERLMRSTGIHQAGCRWIAVRHADDHIHLVATLVSEDTGKRFHPYRDYPKLRTACQELERELGLVATASADRTAAPTPTRAEKGKAERLGRTSTAREELRRIVRHCAATTGDEAAFLAELKRGGVDPQVVLNAAGEIRGYTVALPGDLTAGGTRIRYSGRSLAADLSWPTLTTRWASTPPQPAPRQTEHGRITPSERRDAVTSAAVTAERATAVVRDGTEDVDGIIHAAGDVLAAFDRGREGSQPGPLAEIAERYDRAARTPHRVLPRDVGPLAPELRAAARRLGAVGILSGRGHEKFATVALLLALASLMAEIAAWQQLRGRTHQATAAQAAARACPSLARTITGHRPTTTEPVHSPSNTALLDRPAQRPGAAIQPAPHPSKPARR
jgi:hypothetical protein